MDGLAGRVFRGNLHPVELGGRLVREADLTVHQTPSGPGVSNDWTISINPADLQDVEVPDPLVTELAAGLEQTAAERGWRLEGPCTVRVVLDENVTPGTVGCSGVTRPGDRPAWAYLMGRERAGLLHNRDVVGRSSSCDAVLLHPGVSRTHALIWREAGSAWIDDLGSANGTTLDGIPVDGPTNLPATSVISFGPIPYTFRTA